MAGNLSDEERGNLVAELERSLAEFEQAFEAVPESSWATAEVPGQWSPAQLAEHITLVEARIGMLISHRLLTSEAQPPTEESRRADSMIPRIANRGASPRLEAPEPVRPSGRYETKAEVLKAFRTHRSKLIEYAKTTNDPLRNHRAPHMALGELDGYQWILLTAAHVQRHVAQLQEMQQQ